MKPISEDELKGATEVLLSLHVPSNEVFSRGDGWYLSYLDVPNLLTRILDGYISEKTGAPMENIGRPETAICIEDPWQCLILYGDHREGYGPIAHDLEACKKYWSDHRSDIGNTSDVLEEDTLVETRN